MFEGQSRKLKLTDMLKSVAFSAMDARLNVTYHDSIVCIDCVRVSLYFTMGRPFLKISPSHW